MCEIDLFLDFKHCASCVFAFVNILNPDRAECVLSQTFKESSGDTSGFMMKGSLERERRRLCVVLCCRP